MKSGSKIINYRGGVVRFEIPSTWKEEYEPKGGGTFYENRTDSGTLRLNVLSFKSQVGESSEKIVKRLSEKEPHQKVDCGFFLKRALKEAHENGETLQLHRWEVTVPVPPDSFRIVIFTHTILKGQENDPAIREELEVINTSVRTASYSTEIGSTGDYLP